MIRPVIIGTGSYLPERVLTNADLEKMVETSDEWITTRTGIKQRRIAGPGERTARMAAAAAKNALAMAGLTPDRLDLIIVATISADMTMPSCACLVQQELGAQNAVAFDLNAACSGFVFSLDVADKYIRQNPQLKVLVIGAEMLSGRVDWQDRNTCVLFGDGAGACVLTGSDQGDGLLASRLFADGRLWELLHLANAPRRQCPSGAAAVEPATLNRDDALPCIKMVGRDVFKYAVKAMETAVLDLLAREQLTIAEISLLIPHQANIRILKSLCERLGLPLEKAYINVDKYGNTSAASVPIAIDEASRQGRLAKGDLLLFCVFGGGFTWGAALMRW